MENNWGVKIPEKDPGGKKRKEKPQNLEGEKVRGAAFTPNHAFFTR